MDMVNQFAIHVVGDNGEDALMDGGLSVVEEAFHILDKRGLTQRVSEKYEFYRLNYEMLEDFR